MKSKQILNEIKKIKEIKTNRELAKILNVNESQITRWNKQGFYKSTENILFVLFNEYKDLEEKYNILNKRLDTV